MAVLQQSGRKTGALPPVAIVCFENSIVEQVVVPYNAWEIYTMQCGLPIPVYAFEMNKQVYAFYHSPPGGPACAAVMQEAILSGAKNFLFLGPCGTLASRVKKGSLIVPTHAYRDESTSGNFIAHEEYIEVKTADRTAALLDKLNFSYTKGKTWSTDAIYQKTWNEMRKIKATGCIAVEMECASVMAVGEYHGVNVHQVMYAGSLSAAYKKKSTLTKLPKEIASSYFDVAIELACML